jgi:glycosyltransferase involved in cell wall biosynthesis
LNLAASLLTRPEIAEIHLVAAPWQQGFLAHAGQSVSSRLFWRTAEIGTSTWSRNWWFYAALPRLAVQLSADVVHLAYPVPVHRSAFPCPVVVTLHDLYPYDVPQNFGFPKVHFNRAILRQCLLQVDAVACVSKSTLERLMWLDRRLAMAKARVVVNAVLSPNPPTAEAPLLATEGHPFLLCVAQHRRNKNILLVLQAFERLITNGRIVPDTRLLIVGMRGPETPAILGFIASHGLSDKVLVLQGISEAELQWCYRHCGVLLAPSITEGFGLPVAEGLLAGCRIVCSDIAAFREVGGSRCLYVPLGDGEEESLATAIQTALQLPLPAPVTLPQFSAPAVSAACLELYRSLLPAPQLGKNPPQFKLEAAGESKHR